MENFFNLEGAGVEAEIVFHKHAQQGSMFSSIDQHRYLITLDLEDTLPLCVEVSPVLLRCLRMNSKKIPWVLSLPGWALAALEFFRQN